MVSLRVMTPDDIPAGMRLKDLAGWNQTPIDWYRFVRASPDGCFVAESEGQVCGTATTIVYEQRFAWVGMVLVDPDFRGRGIGTQLLEQAIRYLDARGVPTVKLDATPQGKPIYEKLGFRPEYEIERWALSRETCAPQAESTSMSAETQEHAQKASRKTERSATAWRKDLSDVLDLDRKAFGADRSSLLASLDQEAPEFTITVRDRGSLVAYALGRRGSRADHLGPWLAQDEVSARSLLEGFLARSQRDTVFVDCLKSNPFARGLVRSVGFEFSRPLTRMYRGPNAHPGRPELLCAILGPEFG